jgi:gluconolactonase
MKKYLVVAAALGVLTMGPALLRAQTGEPSVVRLDPALDALVSVDAQVVPVTKGAGFNTKEHRPGPGSFGFTEGLVWLQQGNVGNLFFSDIPANKVYKMTPDGKTSVFVEESGYRGPWDGYTMTYVGHDNNNGKDPKDPLYRTFNQVGSDGLGLDPQGRLLICTFGGRSVDRIEKDGKRVVLADRYDGKKLNGPNDVTVKKNGTIYFSDTFNWRLRQKDPTTELDFIAVYMIKDGKVVRVTTDDPSPNGVALSPDEKILYVTAPGSTIRAYDVQPDDTVKNGRVFVDMSTDKSGRGGPDGMRTDSKGNVYSSGPNGVWVISPEGKHLGTIKVPEGFASFGFGDADFKTLYIGGRSTIYKIQMKVEGRHF